MKKFSVVFAAVALLGFLLAWNPGSSEAAVKVPSGAQDPAQLATASVLPVKASSKTDTILILYRDSADTTTATGTAGDIKLTFYTTSCAKGKDVTINLTRGDVDIGDETSRFFVKDLFVTTASGVILGAPVTPASYEPRWGMSGLVVDGDIGGVVYERQGYPAVVKQNVFGSNGYGSTDSVWAGFSAANFEDFYLYGSGFTTTIQLVCPQSILEDEMDLIAPVGDTTATYEIPTLNVYDRDEVLINSDHNKNCYCFSEDPGGIQTLLAKNTADILGTFHIELDSGQDATGSRVIVFTYTPEEEGATTLLYLDGRIRRATGTATSY